MDIAKFLDRKKRELSNTSSVDEAAAKKQQEECLNDSMGLDLNDIFAQGLQSPQCDKLLFNCLQNLETAKEWQIKGVEQLNEMNSETTFLKGKFVAFEKEIKNNNEEIKSLEKRKQLSNEKT